MPEPLHLTYRTDLDVLIGRWQYQPELADLPAAYEQLRVATLAHGTHRWLQDLRRRSLNDPATTQWLVGEYFPALTREMGRPLRVAYLASPALYERVVAHPALAVLSVQVSLALFGEEGAAIAWLLAG